MKSISLLFILIFTLCSGQSDVPLTLKKQFNGKFSYTIIGNTHNVSDNFTTPTAQCSLLVNSSATLNLLPTQTVISAYLYWGGIGDGSSNPIVQLNGINYSSIETNIGYPENNLVISYFSSVADVTNQLISGGNGTYILSNFNLNSLLNNYCSSGNYVAGWHIIVIYEEQSLQNSQLNIYSGANICSGLFNSGSTPLTINNLNIIDLVNSKMTYVAYNGSNTLFLNESISFNNNILFNSLNPPNNPFNSTNSFTNSTTNWNQDIDTFDISSFINIGDTQANIVFNSFFYRFVQTVVTSIRSELPDATVQINQVTGQNTCNNRNLQVNYTVQNTNSNGNLPANIPVSFYAGNVFLSTVNTPTPIVVGGVLPLQTTVAIPFAVSNTFNLRVVVDNAVGVSSTIAESNENNNEASQIVTLIGNTIISVFALPATFCAGDVVPVLPTTSNNGILGSWSPSVINNQTSGSYTFTPTVGVCATPFVLNVTVNSVLPSFSVQNTLCQGATMPVLPTTSSNGISGSWSPNVIDNQTSGNYIFSPTAGQCALSTTLNVVITPRVTPIFSIQNTFCQGANVPVLPVISNNNILGTWSPNVIDNQVNGAYVFLPNVGIPTPAGRCATSFTLNVVVTPNVTPTFSLPILLCQNAIVPILPLTSNNGISGTWSPNVIDNQTSNNYVFSPNVGFPAPAGRCALPFTQNITIQSQVPTTANLQICNDAQGNNIRSVDLDSGLNPNDFSFVWTKDGQVLPQITALIVATTIGNYQLIASPNGLNCPQIYRFVVTALAPLTANFVVSDDFESNSTITVTATGGSGQYQYSFDNLPFQNSNVFSVSEGGEILVKVEDSSNCYEISQAINVWQFPRFFTPNGDGFNDNWTIKTQKKIEVSIFDRFGKLVKQLQSGESWNGTFNTQPLPADDYWFSINYENKVFKGHFSLKR